MMDVRYINPFLFAVHSVFSTIIQVDPKRRGVAVASTPPDPENLVALIGLSGAAKGTVALQLPVSTALAIVNKWLCMEITEVDSTICDGVAEFVNMIAGQAKATISEGDMEPISLGLPSVVHGASFKVDYPGKTTWLEIPFECELGPFSLRVTLAMERETAGALI
ncbi:MAG: hypothetical protein AMXMBFR84_29040 [Candidatus Hydrogenedentota bacterium]